jgi:hypothetical protein
MGIMKLVGLSRVHSGVVLLPVFTLRGRGRGRVRGRVEVASLGLLGGGCCGHDREETSPTLRARRGHARSKPRVAGGPPVGGRVADQSLHNLMV